MVNMTPTLQAWADITIKQFEEKIQVLNIHDGQLVKSFINHVLWNAGGDLNKVEFAFEYYGRFVDMGVGNGVSRANKNEMIAGNYTTRRAKPWFTSTFYKQVTILRQIISSQMGNNLPLIIQRNIEDNANYRHTATQI